MSNKIHARQIDIAKKEGTGWKEQQTKEVYELLKEGDLVWERDYCMRMH